MLWEPILGNCGECCRLIGSYTSIGGWWFNLSCEGEGCLSLPRMTVVECSFCVVVSTSVTPSMAADLKEEHKDSTTCGAQKLANHCLCPHVMPYMCLCDALLLRILKGFDHILVMDLHLLLSDASSSSWWGNMQLWFNFLQGYSYIFSLNDLIFWLPCKFTRNSCFGLKLFSYLITRPDHHNWHLRLIA